jgi:heme/copper-type cytochrome/quinol oxidase subunit 2
MCPAWGLDPMALVAPRVAFASMLARRLMIAMLVMLGLASLSAALVPAPEERDAKPTSEPQARKGDRAGEKAPGGGRLIRAHLDAQSEQTKTIRLRPGDQLALRVDSDEVIQVAIPEFGQLADVQPGGPARFDVLPTRPGTFPVRMVDPARTIGRIAARKAAGGPS